jgi:hypothetical protein
VKELNQLEKVLQQFLDVIRFFRGIDDDLGMLIGTVHDQALGADAVVGADGTAERRRRPAQLHHHPALLLGVQTEAAVLLRDRQAEQAHLPHLLDHLVGNPVLPGHLTLQGDQALAHVAANRVDELIESLGIQGHERMSSVGTPSMRDAPVRGPKSTGAPRSWTPTRIEVPPELV